MNTSPDTGEKPLPRRAVKKIREMDHRDLGSSGFWISQLFVVAATIIGVYLAAHAGLEQAIAFDRLNSQESNYYLRKSLHDEVADNVSILRTYANETLPGNLMQAELKDSRPVMSRYVWETMRYSPHTLEVPSVFLTEARRFVREADAIIHKAERRVIAASYAAQQMNQLLDRVESGLLPGLRQNYEDLAFQLAEQGIEVTTLKERE